MDPEGNFARVTSVGVSGQEVHGATGGNSC